MNPPREMIEHGVVSFGGWKRCLRVTNGDMELIVTLDVGPRIIRCGFVNEKNVFVEYPDQMGKSGDNVYHSYGGHRLWIAPEEHPKTVFPDNNPVTWKKHEDWFTFLPPAESSTGFQKEIALRMDAGKNKVTVRHRLTNLRKDVQTASVWALSVLAPGGRAIIPHEPFRTHAEHLLPVRPLVLWSYTDMTDPRWVWGKRFIQLLQDKAATTPQKVGVYNTPGWCAYHHAKTLFVKSFPALPDRTYPDFGCNCEFFTNAKMLELESLGPLTEMGENQSASHEEQWYLFRNVELGSAENELEAQLNPLLQQCG